MQIPPPVLLLDSPAIATQIARIQTRLPPMGSRLQQGHEQGEERDGDRRFTLRGIPAAHWPTILLDPINSQNASQSLPFGIPHAHSASFS
jgi:hypothetical protein